MLSNQARCLIDPGELETYLEQEKDKRKKARLVQVRCQSKEIASNIRQAVERERNYQLQKLGENKKRELIEVVNKELDILCSQYSACFDHIGEAHKSVQSQEQLQDLLKQKSDLNHRIAEHRGRDAMFQLRQFHDEVNESKSKITQRRKDNTVREKTRAAMIAALPKSPASPLQRFHSSNGLKKSRPIGNLGRNTETAQSPNQMPPFLNKHVITPNMTDISPKIYFEDKENSPQSNDISLKSYKNQRKHRVSVGYKSQKSKGKGPKRTKQSPSTVIYGSNILPSVIVARENLLSSDARQFADDLNSGRRGIAEQMKNKEVEKKNIERYKTAMEKVQAEKNRTEIMEALETLNRQEKLKHFKNIGEVKDWKDRQEQQLKMEKLVEDMMQVEFRDEKLKFIERPVVETNSPLSLMDATVKKPEIIKIDSSVDLVHASPEMPTTPKCYKNIESLVESSPEEFQRTPELVLEPSYVNHSPKLRRSISSTMGLRPLKKGHIQWLPRNTTSPLGKLKITKNKIESSKPLVKESPKKKFQSPIPNTVITKQSLNFATKTVHPSTPAPRRSSVHKAVVTRELLKNFLETRGVPSPNKKAFTKSYVKIPDTKKTDTVKGSDDASGCTNTVSWEQVLAASNATDLSLNISKKSSVVSQASKLSLSVSQKSVETTQASELSLNLPEKSSVASQASKLSLNLSEKSSVASQASKLSLNLPEKSSVASKASKLSLNTSEEFLPMPTASNRSINLTHKAFFPPLEDNPPNLSQDKSIDDNENDLSSSIKVPWADHVLTDELSSIKVPWADHVLTDELSSIKVPWADHVLTDELDASLSNQSDDSLTREIKNVEVKEAKMLEYNKDVQRMSEEQRQLQEELQQVRRMRKELDQKRKDSEEFIFTEEEQCDYDAEPEDGFHNVTIRRRKCPVTINRGMNLTPHELSTISEVDTPRSSYATSHRNSSVSPCSKSTPKKSLVQMPNEPGILEEPEITFVESETFLHQSSPIKGTSRSFISILNEPGFSEDLSPMARMLQEAKSKAIVSPRSDRSNSLTDFGCLDVSISDSLMSFQRHELSTYNDIEVSPVPSALRKPESCESLSDSEIEEIMKKRGNF